MREANKRSTRKLCYECAASRKLALRRRADFLKAYGEKNRLVKDAENMILVVKKNDWPLPMPVVKKGNDWAFDAAKGNEEVLNRRIGQNELNAIQVVLAYVDAQRQYAMKDRDGDGLLEYAQSFRSEQGNRNGKAEALRIAQPRASFERH